MSMRWIVAAGVLVFFGITAFAAMASAYDIKTGLRDVLAQLEATEERKPMESTTVTVLNPFTSNPTDTLDILVKCEDKGQGAEQMAKDLKEKIQYLYQHFGNPSP